MEEKGSIETRDSLVERAFNVLEVVQGTSSTKEKEAILRSAKDNPVLIELARLTYEPYWIYHVKATPTDYILKKYSEKELFQGIMGTDGSFIECGYTYEDTYEVFKAMLEKFRESKITGHQAIESIKALFSHCTEEEILWYSKVIKKDLKIGASVKTFNKAWGKGTITEYTCALAEPMTKGFEELPFEFYLEPKLDGMRIQAFNYDDEVILRSRNGIQISGFDTIEKEISMYLPKNRVYDGEIMSGKFNNLMTKAMRKSTGKVGQFNIFDSVEIDDFVQEKGSTSQIVRKNFLSSIFKELEQEELSIRLVENTVIFSKEGSWIMDAIEEVYEYYLSLGYEGIIIKDANQTYQYKRSKAWMKMKPSDTYDLEVIELVEGTGKYEGSMGAVVCKFGDNTVNVGSGFSDSERSQFWKDKNAIVGHVIEVVAQEVTDNQKGTHSLRFPRFKGVRVDK